MNYKIPINPRFSPMVNNPMVQPQTGRPPYINIPQNQSSILSAFGLGGPEMSQQQSSMFSSFFGAEGKINPQSIQIIKQQLEQQGVPQDEIEKIIYALNEIQYDKDEQVYTILRSNLDPELADKVQLKVELNKLEEGSGSGVGIGPIGNTGMRSRRGYGGKRRRRTRGRHQRGGYSMSTFSNDAAPITGGRRKSRRHRRRTHKKHGKRSHRR